MRSRSVPALALGVVLCGAARAVMVADPPGRRLNPPPPSYGPERGGWEYVGAWGRFAGIAVSRRHFLTAKHVGGRVGGWFRYRGDDYRAVGRYLVPGADLALWQVERDLPGWAPLAWNPVAPGTRCVVVGRGLAPGTPVERDGRRVGWRWGDSDGRFTWGDAPIARTMRDDAGESLLVGAFTRDGCGLATGDSGGGVFVRVDGHWALAGICRSVERDWSAAPGGTPVMAAALYDARGFFRLARGRWERVPDTAPATSFWFASRVGDRRDFLGAILDAPPGPDWFRIRIAAALAGAGALAATLLAARRLSSRRRRP